MSFFLIFVEPMSPKLHNLYSFLGVGMVTVAEMVMMRILNTQNPTTDLCLQMYLKINRI